MCVLEMTQSHKVDGYMQVLYNLLRGLFRVVGFSGVAPKAMQILVATN